MDKRARYRDFSGFLAELFPFKVQKISLNAGFTCPNRDGTKGYGGCTYCNNQTFNPDYCRTEKSITRQLEEGKVFFAKKYPEIVVGLVIGTRPDCMPDALLDYLAELNKRTFLLVEYGIESTDDETLRRINRGHTFACTEDAVRRTAARGIRTGGHVIVGLPGEAEREKVIRQAGILSRLPLTTLKLHQLQLIKGTRMGQEYAGHPENFHLYTADEYIDLVIDYIEHLRPGLVLERFISQSPKELLIAPDWGMKNYEFTARLRKRMEERDAWQGKFFQK